MLTNTDCLEHNIVRYCSPTLAGLKSGSLFTTPCTDAKQLAQEIGDLNRSLSGKGISILPMRIGNSRMLIYLYRRARLEHDLADEKTVRILEERGYRKGNVFSLLAQLCLRVRKNEEFPHEIGLFLSYPPEDVRGFINDPEHSCNCVGCWKVYGSDADDAQRQFDRYKKCTDIYCRYYSMGKSLMDLTVGMAYAQS